MPWLISLLGVLGSIVIMQGIGWITQTIIAEQNWSFTPWDEFTIRGSLGDWRYYYSRINWRSGAAINAYRSDLVDNLQPTFKPAFLRQTCLPILNVLVHKKFSHV